MHLINDMIMAAFVFHVAIARSSKEDVSQTVSILRGQVINRADHYNPPVPNNVDVTQSEAATTPNGQAGLQSAPKKMTLMVATDASGSYVELGVGTPAQLFRFLLDTGSADSWVKGRHKSDGDTGTDTDTDPEEQWFDPGSSSSADHISGLEKVPLRYAGDITGESTVITMHTETLTVDGVAVPKITIGVAETWSWQFDDSMDGVLALGAPKLARSRQKPVLNEFIDRGLLPERCFSLRLRNALWVDSMIDSDKSTMTLGGFDPEAIEGVFTDLQVRSNVQWIVQADSISITGAPEPIMRRIPVLLDSGASVIIGDLNAVRKLHKVIDGYKEDIATTEQGLRRFSVPCNSPDVVTITFNGQPFQIPPEQLVGDQIEGTFYCWSNIAASVNARSYWVLGSTFFESVYVKFTFAEDGSPAQVSLAKQKEPRWLPGQSPADLRGEDDDSDYIDESE